jgi:hypothetical protein
MFRWNRSTILSFIDSHIINYRWSFGARAGICLVIQILIGVFLAMHYVADISLAFNSVELDPNMHVSDVLDPSESSPLGDISKPLVDEKKRSVLTPPSHPSLPSPRLRHIVSMVVFFIVFYLNI